MDLYLQGKTAVVTGASQGLGREIALHLAAEGVRVFATARNAELLSSLKEQILALGGPEPELFIQDFYQRDAAKAIAERAIKKIGKIDILVNNTGRSQPLDLLATDAPWAASLTLDFERHRQLSQEFLSGFIEQKEGVILNIASTYELRTLNASAVAKAALVVWSKQLAGELGKFGIRVNCLQPGLIDTANIRRFFDDEARREFADREIPMGDFGEAADIAAMATFLVSPRAKYITGTVSVVDGGMRHYPF